MDSFSKNCPTMVDSGDTAVKLVETWLEQHVFAGIDLPLRSLTALNACAQLADGGADHGGAGRAPALPSTAGELLYGEFDVGLFFELVDAARAELPASRRARRPLWLVDVGSGCGRLALAAAARDGWRCCGVEVGRRAAAARARARARSGETRS